MTGPMLGKVTSSAFQPSSYVDAGSRPTPAARRRQPVYTPA
jgi:hypothetical protein